MRKDIIGVIIITFAVVMIVISLNLLSIVMMDKKALKEDDGKVYVRLCYDSNPLSLPNEKSSLDGFDSLKKALQDIDSCEYMVIKQQPINWPEALGSKGKFISKNSKQLVEKPEYCDAAQISENVQEKFELRISAGRLLESSDYKWKGEAIPVLLGSKYDQIFDIGDVFRAEYLYSGFEFEVVGILEEGALLFMSFGSVTLDEKVIMPCIEFDVPPLNKNAYVTQKINGSFQVSGILVTDKKGEPEIERALDKLLDRTDIGELSYYTSLYEYDFRRNGFISPSLGMFVSGILGLLLNALGITLLSIDAISLKRKISLMFAVSLTSMVTYTICYFVSLKAIGIFSFISAGAFAILIIDWAAVIINRKDSNS